MQFCRKVLCQPCSARVTSPEEDMEYKMGSCIGISRRQAEAHKESLAQRDDKALLTEASTSQQSLLSLPVLPDVPVITGVEENRGAAGDQGDKEDELEFPHDLLPSLDFSSELNIWEPHDSDPVLTDAQPSPWPSATPYPDVRPPTPPPSLLLDRELQEAFQECEEQMASLGILNSTEPPSTTSEAVNDVGQKTGEVMVNKSNESSPLPPIVAQPGHSNGGHGNKSTHGNIINPAASADKSSDAQTQEGIVASEAAILTQENRSPLSNSRTCVGESGVESALEEALVVVAALPLTTPTMPEVIESKGEGESVRRDSLERLATVAIVIESEKAVGEKHSGGIEKCLSSAEGVKEGLLDSLPQLSLICSQEKCSLAFSAKEGQTASEESCSSKMPHNSAETEMKGPGETTVRSADTEISPAEEGARENEPLRLEAHINTSPLGLLTGPDCQDHSAAGLEGAGEGGGGSGGGGGEEVEKKGGLAREHSSFSQPEGSASGVSSAETETCPPIDVAESQLKSQGWSEPIATITESICTEKDRLSHPCQEQHGAAFSPLPTLPEQSSSNTNGVVRAELKLNLISDEALSLGHTLEPSITETKRNNSQVFLSLNSPQPLTTSQQIPAEQQVSNNQQVQPESSTSEARTAQTASEFQVQAQPQSNRDTVKQEGSSSVDLRNVAMTAMDCASLPPLTVHECLHHPVVEASYTFPDFLNSKKPEILTNAAPTKDGPAKCPADLTKPRKDVQLDKGDTGTKDTEENINTDESATLETNTVDLQSVTEQPPCPTEKNQTEKNLSPPTQPCGPFPCVPAKGGSDNIICLSHTEPDSTGIKPGVLEASIKDDLNNVSCPLSSDLPTNEAHDETERDNVKEKHETGDQTFVLFEKEKKQVEESTMDNKKETADSSKLQTGKTVTTPQQSNGLDKVAVEEIGDLQPRHEHKVQKTELPIGDKEEGEKKSGIASKSLKKTTALLSDRPVGSSEDMLSAEVESGSELQTVYDQSFRQTTTATLERSFDSDTAPDLSVALSQSQSTTDPKCFAQQQEQQQQRLGSRHPTEELSGGCLEGEEKTNSQVRQTRALLSDVQVVAEDGDGSVGSLCQSGSRDDLTGDDSGANERVIGLEKAEGDGERAAPGADRVYVPSHLASDLNESGRAAERNASEDMGIVTVCSHVGETRQGTDEDKSPGLGIVGSATDLMLHSEFVSDLHRPLPSLESPQLEFLTPTEEIAAPLRQEEIPSLEQAAEKATEIPPRNLVTKPVDLPEPLKKTADLLEPTQPTVEHREPTQSTKVELPEETKKVELPGPTKKAEEPPEELPEPKREPVASSEIAEEPVKLLEPTKSTLQLPEPLKNEEPEPTKTPTESVEPEKKLPEEPVEKPEEPLKEPAEKTAETIQDPVEERQDSW
ncbi:hypothetical protein GBF38_002131 [Nibea albiflora]|uniref:Uncharacterized protein n=1 Tax=Nibea albiflora TaxID=240163 RepID=A0ACB7EDG9_NIBAL|nr:hypothetical protein GBF38_002131 [Nibea albiflora]